MPRKPTTRAAKPLTKTPAPPRSLGKVAGDYWRRLAPLLVELGRLTDLNLAPFEALCRTWAIYRTFDDWVRRNPDKLVFETDKGYQAEAPQIRLRRQALLDLMRLWPKFGLTPEGDVVLAKRGGGASASGRSKSAIEEFAKQKYSK